MALNNKITDWSNKRVWIVGASTGIGAALAAQLHALKAKVAVSARSADKLDEIVARLGSARAIALPLDITRAETIKSAEEKLVAAWGGYDLVVFMAGDYTAMRAWELDLKVAKQMVSINWEGFLNGLSIVIPFLCRRVPAALRWCRASRAIGACQKAWCTGRPRPRSSILLRCFTWI